MLYAGQPDSNYAAYINSGVQVSDMSKFFNFVDMFL